MGKWMFNICWSFLYIEVFHDFSASLKKICRLGVKLTFKSFSATRYMALDKLLALLALVCCLKWRKQNYLPHRVIVGLAQKPQKYLAYAKKVRS